ncbi:MAG: response regulator transcription factor, partial [Lachnospiraceae bacterium]|nr:response regulator transcription factor [Lachnospiraceae bacterium]
MSDKYTILVADDDPSIVNIIETALAAEGYRIITASDGEEAVLKAEQSHPDLVIMDIMMPHLNGLMATMRIREKSKAPILILSAKAEGSDRVIGLEAGADDYLIKPFYRQELIARVKALLRRYDTFGSIRESNTDNEIRIKDIVLDTAGKQLIVRGDQVRLTATEYKILHMLMSNPGHV